MLECHVNKGTHRSGKGSFQKGVVALLFEETIPFGGGGKTLGIFFFFFNAGLSMQLNTAWLLLYSVIAILSWLEGLVWLGLEEASTSSLWKAEEILLV